MTLLACGGDGATTPQPTPRALFGPTIRRVEVEVDYAAGAEPFTGAAGRVTDVWQVLRTNLARLFQGGGRVVDVPSQLSQMERLTDVTGADFTVDQVLAIARAHRDRANTDDTATLYVVWLGGYYRDASGPRPDVLGASFGSSGVIAVFKPVVLSSAPGLPSAQRFVEQSTLVHEIGHAVGLVDRGVPLTSAHLDAASAQHCTNPACVMYRANEGAAAAMQFAMRYVQSGDAVLYGDECLRDVDALAGR